MDQEAAIDYLRDPEEIYRRSFAAVRTATELAQVPGPLVKVVLRLVHACGEPEIVEDLAWAGDLRGAASKSFQSGASILADCMMVATGIIRSRLPGGTEVLCTLNDPAVPDLAREEKTTRSAAAVSLWQPHLEDAVVAIGNAPTALFRLLEELEAGAPRPAAILAFPVGFIGAAESKEALIEAELGIPYITLRGRRGGSALAAAAVNALAGGAS